MRIHAVVGPTVIFIGKFLTELVGLEGSGR